jgi:serine/threonine protein kinase
MGKEPPPNVPPVDASIGQRAVDVGLITAAQLRDVLLELTRLGGATPDVGAALVSKGLLSAAQLDVLSGAPLKRLGKYVITRELGRGGMGVVYEAEDAELGRRVALKLLLGSLHGDPKESALEEERFIREARLSANLPKHPQIIGVYEAGLIEGRRFIAMEFIEGKQFSDWRRQGSITLRQQITVLRDTAMAIDHAHRHGIIHRDLKPANILIDRKNHPHVADFGLAKRTDQSATLSLTSSGMVMGTPAYMSPEQAHGGMEIDHRVDLWSLGVMLYEILTGRLPFDAESPVGILVKTMNDPVPPPSTVIRGASAALDAGIEAVCMKALTKEARRRYPSARAFAEDLGRWLKGERVSVLVKAPVRIKPAWIAGGAAAVLAIGLAAWFALTPSAEERAAERAEEFVSQGRRLAKEGRYGDAMVKFGQALAEDPSNHEAAAGKKDAEARLVAVNRPAPPQPPVPPAPDPAHAKEAIQKELTQLDADVSALRDGEGYGPARDLLTQAARRHPEDQWTTAIAARLEALRKTVDDSFAILKARATTAKKAGDAAGVDSAKARVRTWKWPGLADELDLELARTRETAPTPAPAPVVPAPTPAPTPAPAPPPLPGPDAAVEVRAPSGFRALTPAGPVGNAINAIAYSPDGKLMLTTDFSNVVRLWDAGTRTPKAVIQEGFFGRGVAFSPDGRWFAAGSSSGELKVWDTAGLKSRTLAAQDRQFMGVAFTKDSKGLITSSVDGSARLWDVETGLTQKEYWGHPKGALGFSLSPDGRFIAVGSGESLLRIWEVATGKDVKKIEVSPGSAVLCVSYAPDGKRIACGGTDGAVYLVDAAAGTTRILGRCGRPLRCLAWSPDNRWIATTSDDPSLRLWDPATGSVTGFAHPDAGYFAVAFSPKGDLMAAGSFDWMLHVWELPRK